MASMLLIKYERKIFWKKSKPVSELYCTMTDNKPSLLALLKLTHTVSNSGIMSKSKTSLPKIGSNPTRVVRKVLRLCLYLSHLYALEFDFSRETTAFYYFDYVLNTQDILSLYIHVI